MEPDFSGFATKAGLKCADGRTIMRDAFAHQDGMELPLVWSHQHRDVENTLGKVVLHAVDGDIRVDAYFNDTTKAQHAKKVVQHGDVKWLSIYANKLIERQNQVFHGEIREVSLVHAGANPGAKIDFVAIKHSDGEIEEFDDVAVIHTGLEIEVPEGEPAVEHAEATDLTVEDARKIYEGMDEKEKTVVHYMIGEALETSASAEHSDMGAGTGDNGNTNSAEHSASTEGGTTDLNHQEGTIVNRNAFEGNGSGGGSGSGSGELKHSLTMTRDEVKQVMKRVKRNNGSLAHAFEDFIDDYKIEHGIEQLEVIFPEAKAVDNKPEWMKRRTEWVADVLNGVSHVPFGKIKSRYADITHEDARAKGYIKGTFKKEEWFKLRSRSTSPTTVYKKQSMDRDDLIDITEFDVVVWLKGEMRMMLEEEIARAILLGDGRAADDEDKIKEPAADAEEGVGIRSVLNDHELYTVRVQVDFSLMDSAPEDLVDEILLNRQFYKGTGNPAAFMTERNRVKMLLAKDGDNRRLYRSTQELADAMGVSKIVTVEVMEEPAYDDVVCIMVNLSDYNVGTPGGPNESGAVTLFDDFDIDYNKHKWLIETRFTGALVKLRSALVVKKAPSGATLIANAPKPAFEVDGDEGTLTVPTVTGITYKNAAGTTLTTGSPVTVTPDNSPYLVKAVANSGKYFSNNVEDEWEFQVRA